MKESGIAFQGPMVRAILRDLDPKSVTRRVVRPSSGPHSIEQAISTPDSLAAFIRHHCPHGQPGDILYVREAVWMWCERRPNGKTPTGRDKWRYVPMQAAPVHYQVDHPAKPAVAVVSPDTGNLWGWRLKIARFMPRRVARIRLEITDVRVERLQEISDDDCVAEGWPGRSIDGAWKPHPDFQFRYEDLCDSRQWYRDLWGRINGPTSWDANPWVWCIYFRRIKP